MTMPALDASLLALLAQYPHKDAHSLSIAKISDTWGQTVGKGVCGYLSLSDLSLDQAKAVIEEVVVELAGRTKQK